MHLFIDFNPPEHVVSFRKWFIECNLLHGVGLKRKRVRWRRHHDHCLHIVTNEFMWQQSTAIMLSERERENFHSLGKTIYTVCGIECELITVWGNVCFEFERHVILLFFLSISLPFSLSCCLFASIFDTKEFFVVAAATSCQYGTITDSHESIASITSKAIRLH